MKNVINSTTNEIQATGTLARVWVANQPEGIGHDGTIDYLRAAGIAYEIRDGHTVMPWSDFMAARAAVAEIGHGDDNEGGTIPGAPDLVACALDAEGATEAVQQVDSRKGICPLDINESAEVGNDFPVTVTRGKAARVEEASETARKALIAAVKATGDEELMDFVHAAVDEADIMKQSGGDTARAVQLCRDALKETKDALTSIALMSGTIDKKKWVGSTGYGE